ncbi:ATP cone domain-containing protein [Eudoraea sp.]|uniref:ATP cone domain-containing protein n=1 Tax=Eudoraea sp. TaxID=1979955 RepID=UPI003C75BDAE
MKSDPFFVIKSTGEKRPFSEEKLRASLQKSGAEPQLVSQILKSLKEELYEGISTKEVYKRAFRYLKHSKPIYASKYKLKRAIYELGPTGFPFERFIAAILKYSGWETEINRILPGKCISHEVDVIAKKNGLTIMVECKFHGDQGHYCNVKIPLYIYSRFMDIKNFKKDKKIYFDPNECWVATNTRFTKDAISYGSCMGLYLLSWDHPIGDGLKDRIDRLGLYPITVSTLLTKREKDFLLSRDIVLCRQLLNDRFYLDHLGISNERKNKIFKEITALCQVHL